MKRLPRLLLVAAGAVGVSAAVAAPSTKTPFRVVATIESSQPVLKYGDVIAFGNFELQIYGIYADHADSPSLSAREAVQNKDIRCELSGAVVGYSRSGGANRPVGMCYIYGNDIAEKLVSSGAARDCRDMSHGIYTRLEQEGRARRNEKDPKFLLPPECGN